MTSKNALQATCRHCHAGILTADWDDYEWMPPSTPINVDPTPLDPTGELACIISDRPTYLLEQTSFGLWRLSFRSSVTITRHSPAAIAVLPAHRCGARFDSNLPQLTGRIFAADIPDEVPF